jgi:uncharacterized membrane protein YbhN (UPF0104 family)
MTLASLKRFAPVLGLVLFAGALYLMYRALHGFQWADVVAQFRALPPARLVLAAGLTAASYGVLTLYDALALRYVRHPLPYRRSALAAFVGYSFALTLGHPVLTGGAARYRLYTRWGVSGGDVARIILFAFWRSAAC